MTTSTAFQNRETSNRQFRRTEQLIAPLECPGNLADDYCLYPSFPVEPNSIEVGYRNLATRLAACNVVRIDGYIGVFWEEFRDAIAEALCLHEIDVAWVSMTQVMKEQLEVESLVRPYLGGDDPLFGKRFDGRLRDFFDSNRLAAIRPNESAQLTILYGCGAALVELAGPLVYVDLPKNELQFRSRAGTVTNLGTDQVEPPKQQYKQFYFVDWPVLNRHKAEIVNRVDWFVDAQRPDSPTFISGQLLRDALDRMSRNVFRVRPWFEPGPWGGQWLKSRLTSLPQEVPNYAWSFELIVPENGLVFSDDQHLCEVSFDWLMYRAHQAVLGDCSNRFGYDFPIRFDFLDTFDGGNLSLQCHPRPEYISAHFGEPFTQDETYYIVDCMPGAEAFLGFQQGVDENEFRRELENAEQSGTNLDVTRFVNAVPVNRHDLLLIPSGTIHCSGTNILVLEISATPYIFTFKMYDWQRLGLDGVPRPLNIDRAFENLRFDRQGEVAKQLISQPRTIEVGPDWKCIQLPTHEEHFYDVHRLEFDTSVDIETNGSPHVLMLVEGSAVMVETQFGMCEKFHLLETFVVPAAAGSYRLVNKGKELAKVVKAFIKASSGGET